MRLQELSLDDVSKCVWRDAQVLAGVSAEGEDLRYAEILCRPDSCLTDTSNLFEISKPEILFDVPNPEKA